MSWKWWLAGRFVPFWASWGAKFTKMGDSLSWMPMNRCEKFDAASFIIGREIRNRTSKQTNKTHTQNTKTVNALSTPFLSACADNK